MSNNFRIFETKEFADCIGKLESKKLRFIQNKLVQYVYPQLKNEPYFGHNIKKLRGYNPPMWRYRIGKFRIFYIIDKKEKTIFLLTIEDRKDAYK